MPRPGSVSASGPEQPHPEPMAQTAVLSSAPPAATESKRDREGPVRAHTQAAPGHGSAALPLPPAVQRGEG